VRDYTYPGAVEKDVLAVLPAVKNRVEWVSGMPCLHGSKRETAALTATPQLYRPYAA
jgi:hypothetical protein